MTQQNNNTSAIPPVILYPTVQNTTTYPSAVPQQQPQEAVLQASSTTNYQSNIDPTAENVSSLAEVMERLYKVENEAMEKVKITSTDHKYPKAFFRITVLSSLLLFLVLIIWMLTTPYGYPWFIHIFHAGVLAICIAYIAGSRTNDIHKKLFNIHLSWCVSTVAMFIIANIYSSRYPWAIYPCAFFIFAFCFHAIAFKTSEFFNLFTIHALLWFIVNVMLFIAYCYGNVGFPWNLVVLGVWTFLLVAHFIIHKTIWPKIYDATFGKLKRKKDATNDTPTVSADTHQSDASFNHLENTQFNEHISLPPVVPTSQNMPPLYPQNVPTTQQPYAQV